MTRKLPSRSIAAPQKSQSGFTLVEAVVSLMLLAVMSVMSYQAVEVILGANERSHGTLSNEAQLHRAWQIINRDLFHLRPRTFADGLGSKEPAYITDPDQFGVRFSRGGGPLTASNPTGVSRIEYSLNSDDQLERRSWPITATSLNDDGNLLILLNNVDKVKIEQLSRGRQFVPDWPPLNETHSPLSLPRMIRITIIMLDGAETTRLIPGLAFDPKAGRNSSGSNDSDDFDDEELEYDEDEGENDLEDDEDSGDGEDLEDEE
ncbi:MAG: type II secretion system minor pseudopilin GspJ [Porticoccaceae bacterium]